MNDESLLLHKDGHVATLTLNRPDKLNAIDPGIRRNLPLALKEVQDDDEIRALIITGAGRGFCSGADVASTTAAGAEASNSRKQKLQLVGELVLGFERVNKPVIAAINGVAAGIGLSIALACDIRIASSAARFSAIWVKRGLIADGGASLLLPHIVGIEKALEMSMTGEMVDAPEAHRIRLVSRVVTPEALMDEARALASKLAAMPPISVELVKRVMLEKMRGQIREQLVLESYAQNVCRATEDQKEAVRAFVEKREPVFKGT